MKHVWMTGACALLLFGLSSGCTGELGANAEVGVTPSADSGLGLLEDMAGDGVGVDMRAGLDLGPVDGDLGGQNLADMTSGGGNIPVGYVPSPLDDGPIRDVRLDQQQSMGRVGLRRLSRREVDFTLGDIFQISPATTGALDLYPPDSGNTTVFDNVYRAQSIGAFEIEAFQKFAEKFAADMAGSDNRNKLIGRRGADCTPTGFDDEDCLGKFLLWASSRMFRRDVTIAERDRWLPTIAQIAREEQDFFVGLEWGLRLLLQHPEFLYRVEASSSPDTITPLSDFEIASRMAYLIWGQGPNPWLLDEARAGRLRTSSDRAQVAAMMLDNSRATDQFLAFHQQWLNYGIENIPLTYQDRDDLIAETEQLILRIIEDSERDWFDILSEEETYVSPALAELYGLPQPANASGDWVMYPSDMGRGGGILAHGAYLQGGYKGGSFEDTSPTLRGYLIYKRFLCGDVLSANIPDVVDETTPPAGDCKEDRYSMRDTPGCQGCHILTDGIGFGLEQYGQFGETRAHDVDRPHCAIRGEGSFLGQPFNGSRQLAGLLREHGAFKRCASKQIYRFMMGRLEHPEDADFIEAIAREQGDVRSFKKLLVKIVESPAFITKQGDKTP